MPTAQQPGGQGSPHIVSSLHYADGFLLMALLHLLCRVFALLAPMLAITLVSNKEADVANFASICRCVNTCMPECAVQLITQQTIAQCIMSVCGDCNTLQLKT